MHFPPIKLNWAERLVDFGLFSFILFRFWDALSTVWRSRPHQWAGFNSLPSPRLLMSIEYDEPTIVDYDSPPPLASSSEDESEDSPEDGETSSGDDEGEHEFQFQHLFLAPLHAYNRCDVEG